MSRLCVAGAGRSGRTARVVGRRAGLATVVVGLSLVAGTAGGSAFAAASDPIGYSPAKDVVAVAPLAVSITFGQRLRSSGASLKVIAATGEDVGKGPIGTSHRTLRRDLQLGAPGGDYTIKWTAVSAGGHKMSGGFSFTAARSNVAGRSGTGTPSQGAPSQGAPSQGAPSQGAPSAVASSSTGGTPLPTDDATPATSPSTAGRSATPAQTPTSDTSPSSPTPTGSPTAGLITASRPTWVSQAGPARPGASSGLKNRGLPGGFTAVPLAVAGLLMLSAALVARLKR
jgi:copper resistance protein C